MTMPALGECVTEGTVTRWLKAVGDEVTADEPLLEVSTDKVDTEIPSPVTGTLLEITVSEDETVEVGAELAVIGAGAARPRRSAPAEPQQAEPRAGARAPAAPAAEPETAPPARGQQARPAAGARPPPPPGSAPQPAPAAAQQAPPATAAAAT